jgi:hypothetical protein
MALQLEFSLGDKFDLQYMKERVEGVEVTTEKTRKSMFARHSELAKKYMELHERLQIIERNICRMEVK